MPETIPPFVDVPYWCWDSQQFREQYAGPCWDQANACVQQLALGSLAPGPCQLCGSVASADECHRLVLNQCTGMAINSFCPWSSPPAATPGTTPAPPAVSLPPAKPSNTGLYVVVGVLAAISAALAAAAATALVKGAKRPPVGPEEVGEADRDTVVKAILAGHTSPASIARHTGLKPSDIEPVLRRLRAGCVG